MHQSVVSSQFNMVPLYVSLCLAGILVILQLIWTIKNWHFLKLCNTLPGPRFIPIVGNFFTILANDLDFMLMVYKFRNAYGHIYRIWFGHMVYINLSQAKDVETIMSSQKFINKSHDYSNLHPWLGTGLLTSTGTKWQYRRKIITPTFHFKILDRFMYSFNRNADLLIKNLLKKVGQPAFDVHYDVSLCTLDIICESAMGTTVNAQVQTQPSAYVKAVNNMCWILYHRGIRPWLRIPFIFNLTANGKTFNENLQTLHAMSKGVIQKRRKEYERRLKMTDSDSSNVGKVVSKTLNGNATTAIRLNHFDKEYGKTKTGINNNNKINLSSNRKGDIRLQDDECDVYGSKKRNAFLDHLLEVSAQGENLSDDDIREEVDTIMFEGHDTTAAALSFALYSLATNQHVQDKLYDELYSIFGESDREATYQDLADMKYMERFIKEVLRLYPSVPIFWRDIREEVTLGSGYTLPVGSTVALNVFMLGRNPDSWNDPEQFDPDRFLPENCANRNPFDYTPFSAGPRNCVGQKFAMLEMKVILAKVVRRIRFLPPPQSFKLDLAVEVVLKSRNGVLIRVDKRPEALSTPQ